jgi:hypothetical protein
MTRSVLRLVMCAALCLIAVVVPTSAASDRAWDVHPHHLAEP